MKIAINITVEVDQDEWIRTYGTGETAAELRDEVRQHVLEDIKNSAAAQEGAITKAVLR